MEASNRGPTLPIIALTVRNQNFVNKDEIDQLYQLVSSLLTGPVDGSVQGTSLCTNVIGEDFGSINPGNWTP
jgi:hypothetical protein